MVLSKLMSPFTPFLTDSMYQNLKLCLPEGDPSRDVSVHFLMLGEAIFADRTKRSGETVRATVQGENIQREMEQVLAEVSTMQAVIELGRKIREKHSLS